MTAIATSPNINSHGANDIERGGSSKRRRGVGRRGGVGLGRFTGVGESMLDLRRIRIFAAVFATQRYTVAAR